jgi:hypothetical protein
MKVYQTFYYKFAVTIINQAVRQCVTGNLNSNKDEKILLFFQAMLCVAFCEPATEKPVNMDDCDRH